jgi:GrpB-like predicted nucleotidyltransferase (UPF0157 family)/predicted transcriptional regulator YdeE
MQLVGRQQVLAARGSGEEMLSFYGNAFDRLTQEVQHTGTLSRYVGYQSTLGGTEHLHYIGIEVDRIEDIPKGMVAWDLGHATWTVWEEQGGQDALVSQRELFWQWLEPASPGRHRYTGEFTVQESGTPSGSGTPRARAFWISANAYVKLQGDDVSRDEVRLVDYDPSWPEQYAEMAQWLREALGADIARSIEHYGSTAVPGMPAKPIIDLLVEIPSFSQAKKRAVPLLNRKTWEYWWYNEHMTFVVRNKLMGERTHHVHMAPRGHRLWEGLAFRDYLRSHPKDASRYAALKYELAATQGQDRERYTQAKTDFVREITLRALHDC